MLAFFGQPTFSSDNVHTHPLSYELFIREKINDHWTIPRDFNAIEPDDIEALLMPTINNISVRTVSINLEPRQFVNTTFINMLSRIQQQTDIKIVVELTERFDEIDPPTIAVAARSYYQNGLHLSIDDIGTGANTANLIRIINEYIYEYKFAIQNFRPPHTINEITPLIDVWHDMKNMYHKKFTLEGIENYEDFLLLKSKYSFDATQGYYTGKPALLPYSIVDRKLHYKG